MNSPIPAIIDFDNPKRSMFIRDGEEPTSAIVAANAAHSGLVTRALYQLEHALSMFMATKQVTIILQDQVQLTSGQILDLGPHTVFFSLSYPTAQSRIFEMELAAPVGASIH